MTDLQDKPLVCRDCNQEFIWTTGEQRFYEEKGFANPPSRCPDCRKKSKEERRSNRVTTKIICKECGKEGEVPFQPKDPNDILCSDCFYKMKQGDMPQKDSAPKADSEKQAPSDDDQEGAEN